MCAVHRLYGRLLWPAAVHAFQNLHCMPTRVSISRHPSFESVGNSIPFLKSIMLDEPDETSSLDRRLEQRKHREFLPSCDVHKCSAIQREPPLGWACIGHAAKVVWACNFAKLPHHFGSFCLAQVLGGCHQGAPSDHVRSHPFVLHNIHQMQRLGAQKTITEVTFHPSLTQTLRSCIISCLPIS